MEAKVKVNRKTKTLNIQITPVFWSCSRDFFLLIAEAIKEKALAMSATTKEDAIFLESIADQITTKVQKAEEDEQNDIRNIFG